MLNTGGPVRSVVLAVRRIQAQRLCDQFRVTVGGQTNSTGQHVPPQAVAVDQFTVVSHRQHSVRRVHHKRLTVDLLRGGRRRVSRVTNAQIALQLLHRFVREDVVDHTHALVHVKVLCAVALARDDSGRLLTPVLQGHQPQADNLRDVDLRGPFARCNRPKHAALVCQPRLDHPPSGPFPLQRKLVPVIPRDTWRRES